ncbi:MAG: indole-3-glycerol phosphate synthase TrpC [Candidatus Omnitrophica bacterium]|nr:indole-3-glycerol phosphate synthase TrpC [Candidatus Omnitrophota bacterium]
MPNDFLEQIVACKKELNASKKEYYREIRKKLEMSTYTNYHLFKNCIHRRGQLTLIAEIKKGSPSKGIIREDFDVLQIAEIYKKHNAAAISVLTEDKYFLGRIGYLKAVSDKLRLPTLMKDFFIDEDQIFEAMVYGASAILLIVAILTDDEIKKMMATAHSLNLDCLVEVHTQEELDRALNLDAKIIGINNRNLHTFEISMDTCRTLIPKIPSEKTIVAESGIKTNADIQELKSLGANAVLIGETFMRETDIGAKIDEVMGAIK